MDSLILEVILGGFVGFAIGFLIVTILGRI